MMWPTSLNRLKGVILLAGVLLAGGCAGQVITPPDATHPSTCVDAVPPEAAVLDITGVKSGAFVGDTLHLEASVGGVDRYLVVRFASDGTAWAVAAPDAMIGPANLVAVGAGATRAFDFFCKD